MQTTFFPNPVIEMANIKILNYEGSTVDIAMYNTSGQEVFHSDNLVGDTHQVNCIDQAPGSYFIKVSVDTEVFIEKIDIIE